MIDDLDESSSILRLLVADSLKRWTDNALLGLLSEQDAIVRTAGARELQMRGGRDIFEKVQHLSGNENPETREIAAFILGQIGTPKMPFKDESLPTLLSLADDEDAGVRSATAAAFGHLCYESMPLNVEKCLIKLCSDSNESVRACAAYALGNSSGGKEVRILLEKLLAQEGVGEYAELGLEILEAKKNK
ncbi:HEAT repeat domain-containing protein [Pseudomonas aeruginosa]|uniref:HEAT repeat domain-containing protein n=2 Tax=Pseudomonas aeruginosa TaxID=287 RepID=UPI0009A3137E|nr:HEAT repeat domain-containing protein [Pseudomonas aeruginosa]MCO3122795.1 hypothetical protein [Pseudomonas aeruginosa]MDJ1514756.1 HEAT repeat domain-containing protein [Pseudomonas aeruginosa]MDV6931598.1 hypothetical protein [Pseudomonas aeruginosa]HCF0036567.1 HEAT repeat domain-containing protein [Pseudomonas aeruginosa]HCT8402158.1 HEAT repeat domain-containing protein [Pseudomonas aeruginosa]